VAAAAYRTIVPVVTGGGGVDVAARMVVSFFVSVLWNFPMQRSFVFGGAAK